jgi:SH3-like domain-containing protein
MGGVRHWLIRRGIILTILSLSSIHAAPEKLPLPRFASIRSNKVNVHVGPGTNYPIEWTYTRQGLPVEIIAEFDTWRQIKDSEGAVSWVHKSLLSGKRTIMVTGERRELKKKPAATTRVVAYLEPGVIAKVKKCEKDWCQVEVHPYSGWIERKMLWGIYAHENQF